MISDDIDDGKVWGDIESDRRICESETMVCTLAC